MSEAYEELDLNGLLPVVAVLIGEVTNTDPSEIAEDSLLMEDLNMTEDSLRMVARRMNFEFDIQLNIPELIEEFETMNVTELTRYAHEEIAFG